MKKSLLFVLAMLIGAVTPMVAQSSTDDYVPLVKEGVRWECEIVNRTTPEYVEEAHYYPYDIVISGDSIINDIKYKKCHYIFKGYNDSPCDETMIALLREDVDAKRVYIIFSSNYNFPIPHVIPEYKYKYGDDYIAFDKEILLYDFADLRNSNLYWEHMTNFTSSDIVIDNISRKMYINNIEYNKPHGLIEGIGNMGHPDVTGDLLFPQPLSNVTPAFPTRNTDPVFLNYYNEKGELVYSSGRKASVESIVTDLNAPTQYYNLQGVKVDKPQGGVFIKVQGDKATKVYIK